MSARASANSNLLARVIQLEFTVPTEEWLGFRRPVAGLVRAPRSHHNGGGHLKA